MSDGVMVIVNNLNSEQGQQKLYTFSLQYCRLKTFVPFVKLAQNQSLITDSLSQLLHFLFHLELLAINNLRKFESM